MTIQTNIPTPRADEPTNRLDRWAAEHGILTTPADLPKDVEQSDVYREFLRWPTFLWIPGIVVALTWVASKSLLAAVPVAFGLTTVACLFALRAARARLAERLSRAGLIGLVPQPRSGRNS
ncbi:MAG TPA: hypothetical protein VG650_15350 [Mycobacteriales bacterium]|nr:hypothetical protein [Mycobacteriales bacterium]